MVTQEKMYDMLFNNQKFVEYINSTHFSSAVPNEDVLNTMLNNEVYADYLITKNPNLNKVKVVNNLNRFPDKFWLKKDPLCLIMFLREVKQKKLICESYHHFFTQTHLVNALLNLCNQLATKTNANENIINEIADYADENIIKALKLLIKHNLIR